MSDLKSFERAVDEIRENDTRFSPYAYAFLRRCLDHSVNRLGRSEKTKPAHVSGGELLLGFRDLAIKEFGPMARTVLENWGVHNCTQVGEIVFQLVQHGILGKSDTDHLDDFQEIWTFREAFEQPFLPKPCSWKTRPAAWRPKKRCAVRRKATASPSSSPHGKG